HLDVRDAGIKTPLSCELDHARREIGRYDLGRRLAGNALGEVPHSAADFEDAPGFRLGDRLERDVEGIRAVAKAKLRVSPDRKTVLLRVLAAGALRGVWP